MTKFERFGIKFRNMTQNLVKRFNYFPRFQVKFRNITQNLKDYQIWHKISTISQNFK